LRLYGRGGSGKRRRKAGRLDHRKVMLMLRKRESERERKRKREKERERERKRERERCCNAVWRAGG
jgi:hypothetical protein